MELVMFRCEDNLFNEFGIVCSWSLWWLCFWWCCIFFLCKFMDLEL